MFLFILSCIGLRSTFSYPKSHQSAAFWPEIAIPGPPRREEACFLTPSPPSTPIRSTLGAVAFRLPVCWWAFVVGSCWHLANEWDITTVNSGFAVNAWLVASLLRRLFTNTTFSFLFILPLPFHPFLIPWPSRRLLFLFPFPFSSFHTLSPFPFPPRASCMARCRVGYRAAGHAAVQPRRCLDWPVFVFIGSRATVAFDPNVSRF